MGTQEQKPFSNHLQDDLTDESAFVSRIEVTKRPAAQRIKRANEFPMAIASTPDTPSAMAISEDGKDFSYFANLKFGSEGKDMWLLVDTGAASTWVMGSDCTTSACKTHQTFGSQDSTSLNISKETWSVTYGTGTVSGAIVSDTIAFANYTIELEFGLASVTSDDFNSYPMDGILGLGRPDSSTLGSSTFMAVVQKEKLLKTNILGIHLQRNSDGATDGQITLGDVDKSKFDGDISYTNTVSPSGMWEISANDAGVGGKSCNFTGKTAIIDTGTSYILMPPGDAKTLHDLIPGSTSGGSGYMIPCNATEKVQFSFSGVTYDVSAKDYLGRADDSGKMCASNIIGLQAFGPNTWLLGDVFLKNVYSVFDFDQNRIGFGTKSSSSSSSASTSMASAIQTTTRTATSQPLASASVTVPAVSIATKVTPSSSAVSMQGAGSPLEANNAAPTPQSKLAIVVVLTILVSIIGIRT